MNLNIDFSGARSLKRFPLLDSTRGLACLGVVAFHCDMQHWMRWYWGVMDFFFVMSGFLITRSLITNCDKGRGTWSFLLYRALRLMPAYLTVILIYELLVFFVLHKRQSLETLPYLLLYQHMDYIFYGQKEFSDVFEFLPYWSLVLEERFYLVWGIIFCGFAYAKLRINLTTVGVVMLLLGFGILWRALGLYWWTLPARFGGFLLGSMASLIIFMPQKLQISKRVSSWLIGGGWLLAAAALVRLVHSAIYSYQVSLETYYDNVVWLDVTCYSVVSVILVLGLVKLDMLQMKLGKIQKHLAFFGLLSYEIYLVHFAILTVLKRVYDFKSIGSHQIYGELTLFVIAMFLSTGVAYVMHKTLTAPALKCRERIHTFFTKKFGKKAATAAPASAAVEAYFQNNIERGDANS